MRLINHFKFSSIFWIVIILSAQVVSAQQNTDWSRAALKDSVISLLSEYQELHNQLNNHTEPTVEREFMRLFENPKVPVINELDPQPKRTKISIDEFIMNIGELFPDGLTVHLDLTRMSVGLPRYDRNGRYIMRIRVPRSLNGISGGKVFSSNQRVIFDIAFTNNNLTPQNFSLYGMDLPSKDESFLSVTYSPSLTGFANNGLDTDLRFSLSSGTGQNAGINYSYYFSDHWGFGSGAQFSHYRGTVELDKFDALGSFNPNFKDVVINNELWFVEVPLFLSFKTHPLKRLELWADIGLSLGIRTFESMTSSAVNTNTGAILVNVFSDTDWISLMNRFNLGLQGTIGFQYRLTDRMGILIGAGIRQGISGLDHNVKADFLNSKYLGRYNPLWAAPDKTVNQALFVNLGVIIRLNKEQN